MQDILDGLSLKVGDSQHENPGREGPRGRIKDLLGPLAGTQSTGT